MRYLIKTPISQIEQQRQDNAADQNVDLYAAIAGLSEDLATAQQTIADLTVRVVKLEGGK
ncbi:MAG TPA: transcription factor [Ruminiclostridium sp.]|nr:transcription factor [Ruminiclostridium sp.]